MIINKNSIVHIILPQNYTLREEFAATELSKYLKKIVGEDLSIEIQDSRPDTEGEICFLIGGPKRNEAVAQIISCEAFDQRLTGPEGIYINVANHTVILAGSDGYDDKERGTIYAVYEFLERFLNCTFGAYSHPQAEAGEIIPQTDEAVLTETEYVKGGADRPYRSACVEYGEKAGEAEHELNVAFFDWLIKNRYNYILTWTKIYEKYKELGLIDELVKRGINLLVGHHDSTQMWLPFYGNNYFPERYVETHPEYYRLNADGKRFVPQPGMEHSGQVCFCCRNTECIEQYSKNLIEWLRQNPAVDMVSLYPLDHSAEQCSCDNCKPYSKMENYMYFLNGVAKRLSNVYPKILIEFCVYNDLWDCPEDMEFEPTLFMTESTWGPKGLRSCGKPDGSGLIGTYMAENLDKWQQKVKHTGFYDYYMGVFSNRQRVIPMADELQSIWQYYVDKNVDGATSQAECFNIWNHLVNLYGFARTGYDVSLSFQDLLTSVCRLFGEGAAFVEQAVKMMEETLDGQETIEMSGKYMITHIDKQAVYELFEQALTVTTEKRCRNNLRLMRMAFRYSDLETTDPYKLRVGDPQYDRFQEYDDPTGELAYIATNFDSFYHNDPGYAIAFPITNTDTKGFVPNIWYAFD